jgi:tetratricopeptide (TPR) repeat protein
MTHDAVTPDEVFAALERVLDSDAFLAAPQSRNFLAFVVTETLAGRGHRLSERTVGRGALHRPDDFDGRFDASVRVRATRVRKALETYYETSVDPVRIELPAGTYTPRFRRTGSVPPQQLETAVVITTASGDAFAETMSQEMARQLAAFPALRVVGPIPGDEPNRVATGLGVRFVLHVATTHDATAAELNVLDTTSDATVWKARERLDAAGFDVGQWAQSIAGQIGDYTGVILKRLAESQRPGESEWQAMQAYYAAYTSGDRQAVIPAADRLTQVVANGHHSPTIVAALAHSLSLRAGYEFTDDVAADLTEATSLAREALAVDPGSATAHLALATVALVSGQPEGAQEHALKAAELAPYHPSILQTAGTLIALAGNWDQGIAVIRDAMGLNPNLPGYMRQLLVLDHLFAGDDALALAEASRIETPTEVWGPYFRALSLMGLGYQERAHAEMEAARAIEPTVLDDSYDLVQAWVQLTPGQLQVLAERLRMFQSHE